MNEFVLRAKKTIKKLVALSVGAAMVGATMGGAVAAADLSTLHQAGTILSSDGNFDAYVVVGKNADPADVVGAIDVAAAFAQKAQGTSGAGSGTANLAVQEYKGSTNADTANTQLDILENSTTAVTANYESAYISNYTKIVNDTLNWTTVQKATVEKAGTLVNMGLHIPKNTVKMYVKLYKDVAGTATDKTVTASQIADEGPYLHLFGTEYYVVNITQGENITLGSSTKYSDQALPAQITTDDGYVIDATAGSSGKVILQITSPAGTQSSLTDRSP